MKSKFLAIFLVLGVSSSAYAQFGGLMGGNKSGGDPTAQIQTFNTDALLINKSVGLAMFQIQAALGTKEDIAAIKEKSEGLNNATNTKEVGSIQGSTFNDSARKAQELLSAADAKEKMAKLSPQIQKAVANSIMNVAIAALKMPVMMKQGQEIISGVGSNPMNISKVLPVKDGLALFSDALPKLPTLVSTGMKLMRDVKVDPGNPTATTPIKLAAVTFPD